MRRRSGRTPPSVVCGVCPVPALHSHRHGTARDPFTAVVSPMLFSASSVLSDPLCCPCRSLLTREYMPSLHLVRERENGMSVGTHNCTQIVPVSRMGPSSDPRKRGDVTVTQCSSVPVLRTVETWVILSMVDDSEHAHSPVAPPSRATFNLGHRSAKAAARGR
jgi:hypothetical protein